MGHREEYSRSRKDSSLAFDVFNPILSLIYSSLLPRCDYSR